MENKININKLVSNSKPKKPLTEENLKLIEQLQNQCKDIIKNDNLIELENFVKKYTVRIGGFFPFRYACRRGKLKLVTYLVENDSNIYVNDNEGLKNAIDKNHLEIVQYLIKKDTNCMYLKNAVNTNNTGLLFTLVSNGANVNYSEGLLLNLAVEKQLIDVVDILLQGGANVHFKNDAIVEKSLNIGNEEIINLIFARV